MNIINWVLNTPIVFATLIALITSGVVYLIIHILVDLRPSLEPADRICPSQLMDQLSTTQEISWLKMYAGCLGNTVIHYRFTSGEPTMSSDPIYGHVDLLSVKLQNGLEYGDCILSTLTAKQTKLLCATVYREHERRELFSAVRPINELN